MSEYISPNQAKVRYNLGTGTEDDLSEVGKELAKEGIVAIEMPLSSYDFQRFSEGFGVCLEEYPDLLHATHSVVDSRYGSEVGYTRKEAKFDRRTGTQVGDAKNYFHFSESARLRWRDAVKRGPKLLRDFLEDGFEIHEALLTVAKQQVSELESSHPNISSLYFPRDDSFSFLRLLRYDGYEPVGNMGVVAKPHFDIAGVTIQAYADAPGFWRSANGVGGEKVFHDTNEHEAYLFLGKGHEKVYGPEDALSPLWHGVDRVIPTGVTFVPERTAVILFLDAPEIDYHMRESDTLPYLARRALQLAL